jgi:RecA-family ATPase
LGSVTADTVPMNTTEAPAGSAPASTVPLSSFIFDPEAVPPPSQPIFRRFLSKGDLVVWIGREKHRKSNVLLQFAIAAAIARNFLHFRFAASQPCSVVYVDYETKAASLKVRYEALCCAMAVTEEERLLLRRNLKIIQVREARAQGKRFHRFPAKLQKNDAEAVKFWDEFAKALPADLYIFDPMRCLHAEDENDSLLEALLSRLITAFRGAAVIVAHHMRKRGDDTHGASLCENMRGWSDGARGSGAIKAHADLVVCQERVDTETGEIVHLGAFSRDEADVNPLRLEESAPQSFYWCSSLWVPDRFQPAYDALRKAGRSFTSKADAAHIIVAATRCSRATAFRRVGELLNVGALAEQEGSLECTTTDFQWALEGQVAETQAARSSYHKVNCVS